ncbi:hypothetical protein Tco_1264773 [Tanacetum coccineum]
MSLYLSEAWYNDSSPSCLEVVNIFKLLHSLGRSAIHLDKGLFDEILGIDSSWGESVHPSFCGSGKSKGKNSKHDCVFRNSRNVEKANDAEDPINVIMSILVFVPGESVEFFKGWKPKSPLQLAVEEVMSE